MIFEWHTKRNKAQSEGFYEHKAEFPAHHHHIWRVSMCDRLRKKMSPKCLIGEKAKSEIRPWYESSIGSLLFERL